jgi:O-antigen/teichoic acid export membrane protein
VGFVTAPLIARALGPDGRGLLAAIMVPLGLAPWIFQFGTGLFAVKEAARGVRASTLLGSIGAVNVAFGLLATAGGLGIAGVLADGHPVVEHYLVIGFALLPALLLLSLVADIMLGLQRWSGVLSMRGAPPLFWCAGIAVLYVGGRLTVATAATVFILSSFSPLLPALAHARIVGRPRFRKRIAKEGVAFGSKVWLGTLAQTANSRLDQLLMIALVSPRELGLYSVAVTIAAASGVLSNPIASMALPKVAGAEKGFAAQATRLGVLIAVGTALVVGAAVPFLMPLVFTSEFNEAVPMTLLLLVGGVFATGTAILRPVLAAVDRPGVGSVSEISSLLITVPGLFLLLPSLGGIGAALISIVAYAASFLVLVVSARRRFGLPVTAFMIPRPADVRWLIARVLPAFTNKICKSDHRS